MSSILVCGSVALKHWLPDFERNLNDIDYIGYKDQFDFNKYGGIDSFETTDNFIFTNSKLRVELIDITNCSYLQDLYHSNIDNTYMDLKSLLILKNSHKYFYLGKYLKSFKHLMDYSYLYSSGYSLTSSDINLSNGYRDWLIANVYNNDERLISFPNLDKSKDKFFTEHVKYYVDHDYIHEVVAIEDKPAYTNCLIGEVKFSNKLFIDLDYQTKVNMVLEESFVLAFERCLIPMLKGDTYLPATTPNEAFKYALVRVSTNITSGVFRSFAADNFYNIYQYYLKNFKNYFKHIDTILGE